jgi:hypothetical protein
MSDPGLGPTGSPKVPRVTVGGSGVGLLLVPILIAVARVPLGSASTNPKFRTAATFDPVPGAVRVPAASARAA